MGRVGGPDGTDPVVRTTGPADLRGAYDAVGSAWARGPERLYDRLAEHLVGHAEGELTGRVALDTGAGHGAATRALQARGAHVVAADISLPMLLADAAVRPPAVVADVCRLPLHDAAVDLTVASFVLSHLPDPAVGLREMDRVTRSGGLLLASAFAATAQHPAKTVVEDVATTFGYRRPGWYEHFKSTLESKVATVSRLRACAAAAGLRGARATETTADLGTLSPRHLVAWRLGTPSMADFVAGLDSATLASFVAAAERALAGNQLPVRPRVLVLSAVAG